MAQPDSEQFNSRIDPDVLRLLRVYATVEGRSQRAILEEALTTYFESHTLDLNPIHELVERLGEDQG